MIIKLATIYIRLFNLVASADHHTPLTGATPTVLLSKNGAAFAAHDSGGVIAEVGNGVYSIVLTAIDTNTNGNLALYITAASADPNTLIDDVQPKVLNDLNIDTNGNATIASSIKKNAACNGFMFIMTNNITHAPQAGLTVSAQRSLAGAGFAPCANSATELGNGVYVINLAAADTNANNIMFRFTATGADDLDILIQTQP